VECAHFPDHAKRSETDIRYLRHVAPLPPRIRCRHSRECENQGDPNRLRQFWIHACAIIGRCVRGQPPRGAAIIDSPGHDNALPGMLAWELLSVSRFLPVPKGQYIHGVIRRLVSVQCHIAGIAEGDQQFAQFRQFRYRSASVRAEFQQRELPCNGFAGALRGPRILCSQKLTTAFQAAAGPRGNDYSWHSGSAVSVAEPQVFSHVSTSSPVRCRPVSR